MGMIVDTQTTLRNMTSLNIDNDELSIFGVDVVLGSSIIDNIKTIIETQLRENIKDWTSEMFAIESKRQYLNSTEYKESGYSQCPKCANENISKGTLDDVGGDIIKRHCSCGSCGEQWEEQWSFDNIQSETRYY